jgi:hypothetical protein
MRPVEGRKKRKEEKNYQPTEKKKLKKWNKRITLNFSSVSSITSDMHKYVFPQGRLRSMTKTLVDKRKQRNK